MPPEHPSTLIPSQIQAHVACYACHAPHPPYANPAGSTGSAASNAEPQWWHLVLRRADGEAVYPRLWQAITGTIEHGETAVEAAFREIEEETGVRASKLWVLPFVGSYFDPRRNVVVVVPCFGAVVVAPESSVLEPDFVRLSDEHSAYQWLSIADAEALLPMPSHKQAARIFHNEILCKLDTAPFQVVSR
jgi:8-oxo-dGTP pyrophosphatase MutT (NUDIX family)